jgi:phytoene dehydrogenase-like protein
MDVGPGAEVADAVVIGAGPNGLVAANLLADAGWSVLVLEAADEPGGAVRTGELALPGFNHDLCSAFYPMAAASPVIAGLELEQHGLRWRHSPAVLAHVFPDDRHVVLSRDVAQTASSLAAFDPRDADAWPREFERWQRVRDDVLAAILGPFPPVRAAGRLLRTLGGADLLRLTRLFTLPARRLGEELFAGEGARILLAGNAMHTDLGPDQAGSGIFGWLLTMLGQDIGYPVPEGGAGRFTEALVSRLTAKGGRIECGRRVTSVLIAGRRALGVRDAGGEPVRARLAVLADVPAPTLYRELVGAEALPAQFVRDLSNFQWDDATIKVDWALSGPIPWNATSVGAAGTVHLGADLNGLAQISTRLACGQVPDPPFLLLGQMATADPTRSPAGTETVWAYTHVPRGEHWDTRRLSLHADWIERFVDKHANGFRDRIMGRAVTGPAEFQRRNPSLVEGAINAGTSAIHQQLVFRPVPGVGRADTPIERLFLASSSAHPGGGVHGSPGANAARAALASTHLPYRLSMRAINRYLYGSSSIARVSRGSRNGSSSSST